MFPPPASAPFSFACPAGEQIVRIAGGPKNGFDMMQFTCDGGATAQYGTGQPQWEITDVGFRGLTDVSVTDRLNGMTVLMRPLNTLSDPIGVQIAGSNLSMEPCPSGQFIYRMTGNSGARINTIGYQCRARQAYNPLLPPTPTITQPITVVLPTNGILPPTPVNPIDTTIANEPTFGPPSLVPIITGNVVPPTYAVPPDAIPTTPPGEPIPIKAPTPTVLPNPVTVPTPAATYPSQPYSSAQPQQSTISWTIVFIFLFLFICIIAGVYIGMGGGDFFADGGGAVYTRTRPIDH
jgi:hypothetical protein